MNSNTNSDNKRSLAIKIVSLILAVVFVVSVILLAVEIYDRNHYQFESSTSALDKSITYNGNDYVLNDDLETLLVLGLDKFGETSVNSYNNDKQADFLLLFVIDNNSKTYKIIHLNRDSMVEMNVLGVAGDKIDTAVKQLALSHTYGNGKEVSCRNVANAVSGMLLGAEIDHYVSATMDAVGVYNELVGGVTVEVLDDFTAIDKSMVMGETITLTGDQALKYVRSRDGLDDPSNERRMVRQKQYLEALSSKTRQIISDDKSFVSKAGLEMSKFVVSDCSVNKLESYMNKLSEYDLISFLDIDGSTVVGEEFLEFYPNEASVKEVVINCFYTMK
jgi:LCP family protein required for cell wall assembly